jgi:hypothetical protein
MVTTIRTRPLGGAVRWLAIPLVLAAAGAALISVAANADTLGAALGSRPADVCMMNHAFQCNAAGRHLAATPALLPTLKVAQPQASSPLTPADQLRAAQFAARLAADFPGVTLSSR